MPPITVTASTSVVLVNTTSATNTVLLPYLSSVGRLITIRDNTGYAQNSTITITTTGGAVFYDGTTSITINQPFGFVTLSVLSGGNYALLNTFAFPAGNAAASVGSLTTSNILLNDRGTSNYYPFYSSNASLYFISTPIGDVTLADLTSTVNGLGTAGYLSSLTVPVIPTYVAVGATSNQVNGIRNPLGSIIYSLTSGTLWTNAGGTGGFLTQGWDVAYNNGFYVACGDNSDGITPTTPGHLQWSADGTTWSYSATALGSNQARSRVIYANGLWHSVGSNSATTGGAYAVVYSGNGKNWFPSVSSPEFPAQATGIAFGAGLWVYTASNVGSPQRSVQWSLDGSNWNAANSVSWVNGQAGDVAYDGYRFVVVVSGGTNPNASNLAYSFDGSNWTGLGVTGGNLNFAGPVQAALATQPNTSNWLLAPYPGATVGFGQLLKRSITGGTAWLSNTNISGYYRITRPYYDGTKWWAGFQTQPFGTTQTATDQAMYYSFNGGQTWQNTNITGGFSNGGYPNGMVVSPPTIDYGLQLQSTVTGLETQFTTGLLTVLGPGNVRDQWVAVGSNTSAVGTIKTSSNGINWCNAVSGGFSNRGKGITYSGSLWVAVGDDPNPLATAQYSTDGSNWSNAESGLTTTELEGVAYNGSLFIACGSGGFFYSFSGSNWYNANASVFPGGRPYAVAWNGYMWVAVGQSGNASNIAYSMDGSNWSNANSGFFQNSGQGVSWNTRYWVAVGDQSSDAKTSIKYSYDGLNWSNSIFGGFGNPAGTGNAVTWNGNIWVAAGVSGGFTQSNLQYSTDGSNWFRSATNTFTGAGTNGGAGIATDGTRFVAVGQSADTSTILYSDDGSNWSPGTGALFTDYGLAVAYSLYGTADITLKNLGFYTKDQDTFLTSTHTIATTDTILNIDNTLFIDRPNRRVGILTSSPTVALEVNGTMKTTTLDTVNMTNNVQVIDSMTMQGPLYASNIYVATGANSPYNSSILYSYDSITWSTSKTTFSYTQIPPVYSQQLELWIAAGRLDPPPSSLPSSRLQVNWSSNGINWNSAVSGDFYVGGLVYRPSILGTTGNNLLLGTAQGYGASVFFSPDGSNWYNSSNISLISNVFFPDGNGASGIATGVAYMSNLGVTILTGNGGDGTMIQYGMYYSIDQGSNFQVVNPSPELSNVKIPGGGVLNTPIGCASDGSNAIVLVGGEQYVSPNTFFLTQDGSNFVQVTSDFSELSGVINLNYAGGIWFIGNYTNFGGQPLYYSSNNCSNWYSVAATNFSPDIANGGQGAIWNVTFDGSLWYASGKRGSGGGGLVYYSSNLTNWYQQGPVLYNDTCYGFANAYGNTATINKIITNSLGVGTNNPQYAVDIRGQLRVTSTILAQAGVLSNGVYLTSDSNVKENIEVANYNLCYSNVKDLELKRFRFISSYAATKQDQTQLGFIAQEAQQHFPKSVIQLPGLNYGPPTLHLNTDQIFMTHYGATRYLMDVVETQDSTISTLLAQVEQMKDRVVRYTGSI